MQYSGKLYGKIGRRSVPLTMTSEDVDRMERENARLKADAERLDKLEKGLMAAPFEEHAEIDRWTNSYGGTHFTLFIGGEESEATTLREAIDALPGS